MKARPRAADVAGLLGIPWAKQDCGQLAQRALLACGLAVPDHAFGRFGHNDQSALATFTGLTGGRWLEVGATPQAARALGDVIVTRYGGSLVHLSVLVDEGRRLALTTSASSGSACVRVDNFRTVWKVIRWQQ